MVPGKLELQSESRAQVQKLAIELLMRVQSFSPEGQSTEPAHVG